MTAQSLLLEVPLPLFHLKQTDGTASTLQEATPSRTLFPYVSLYPHQRNRCNYGRATGLFQRLCKVYYIKLELFE